MKINNLLPLQRIIGKVDNDFNIDDSDWIPRVGAWVIDALSQLKVLPMQRKRRKLDVVDKIAIFPCVINTKDIHVYDMNGCKITYKSSRPCCINDEPNSYDDVFGEFTNSKDERLRVRVHTIKEKEPKYFTVDNNKIILNFNTDYILVESLEVATYYDDYYNCEVPYVYDDGILLEALCWYILFKYLSRGGKHPVYSLTASNDVLNPYRQWLNLKNKATASVLNSFNYNEDGWNNFFFNSTFLPRN